MAQWYFAKGGQQQGPLSIDELRSKIARGEVGSEDLVWREGMPEWRPAGVVSELGPVPQQQYNPPAGGPPQGYPAPYQQPSAGYAPMQPGYPMPGQPIGYQPQGAYSGAPIPNYLVHSILATVFCCMPLGVVAIIFAAQVSDKQSRGDIAGAMEASRKAKTFSYWAIGSGFAVIGLYFLFIIIMVAAGA
jgi:hypothetical protein